MSVERLVSEIGAEQVAASGPFSEVWVDVLQRFQPGDRAVVFGSFHMVSEALGLLAQQRDV
jgi:folylpolyglutamate synthase/dihydropteroate synthase